MAAHHPPRPGTHRFLLDDCFLLVGDRASPTSGQTLSRGRSGPVLTHPDHVGQASAARVWELRETLSAYDASYVALAEQLGCPLLTCDGRISRAPGVRCPITVVPG